MALDLSNLNQLDFKAIGTWPVAVKAILIAVLCAVVLALGYFLHIQGLREELARAVAMEQTLKTDFEGKQSKAVALDAYKQQMKEMEESFGTMLRQLPSKTEVEDLLIDISQTGLGAGLTFDLFKPDRETPHEFYAELPIAIQVTGGYHAFGAFASGVAALPRIVTLQDITIKTAGGKSEGLVMVATAKTYRYLAADEIAAKQAAEKGKKGKRR
ncbi:MAG: type 4a pilus biogenesis protein PilO [Gammaproteobacteria bacterium]|nr:type 4a pilus biogenesis protein PilO [Gammaproteobacteria bacterium]